MIRGLFGFGRTGSFGRWRSQRPRARNTPSPIKQIVAWKELHYGNMTEREKQQLVKEVNILRELEHPNIVKYLDRVIGTSSDPVYARHGANRALILLIAPI